MYEFGGIREKARLIRNLMFFCLNNILWLKKDFGIVILLTKNRTILCSVGLIGGRWIYQLYIIFWKDNSYVYE